MGAISIPVSEDAYSRRWLLARVVDACVLILAVWVVQTYHQNRSPLEFVLIPALAGLAALPVVAWKRFRLIDFGDAEKPSLAVGFYTLLLVIGVHALEDQTMMDRLAGLWVGVIVGLVLGALIIWLERPVKAFWAFFAVTLLIFAAWGMTQMVNCLLDQSSGYAVHTEIGDRYNTVPSCSQGSRYRSGGCVGTFSQYVVLSPAPYGLPARLSVDPGWYRHSQVGDRICIVEHPGRFGARWYRFDLCPTNRTPS